jgi:hypothetical protein
MILHRIQLAEFCEIVVSPNQKLYSRFFPLVYCVPTILTSLFIGFWHISNGWKA